MAARDLAAGEPSEADLFSDAVDDLVDVKRRRVILDDADHTTVWATIPSLWDQLVDSADAGARRGTTHSVAGSRLPIDLDVLELMSQIRHAVRRVGLTSRASVPGELRALRAHVLGVRDVELSRWWSYQVRSWVRQANTILNLVERRPQPRRVRDTACPSCEQTHVAGVGEDGEPTRVPALLIDFHDGLVRAAQCDACGVVWWRGEELLGLAAVLATRREARGFADCA